METITFKQLKEGKGYLSDYTRNQFIEDNKSMKDEDILINFAYTDYGGTFFDRVCIEYFKGNKDFISENTGYFGMNGILIGQTAIDFLKEYEIYPLGYEDIEEFYYQKQYEAETASFKFFIEDLKRDYEFNEFDLLNFLMDNRTGYYSVQSSGDIDFSYDELTSYILKEFAGINEIAK